MLTHVLWVLRPYYCGAAAVFGTSEKAERIQEGVCLPRSEPTFARRQKKVDYIPRPGPWIGPMALGAALLERRRVVGETMT